MDDESFQDVRSQDPTPGHVITIMDDHFRVAEQCPCGAEAGHTRWFLEGDMPLGEGVAVHESATLTKEWDENGETWWWFGRRIAPSDVRRGEIRLPVWIAKQRGKVPKILSYEGKRYKLLGDSEPVKTNSDPETIPLILWEYVDGDEVESLLVEQSPEGHLAVYHGAYHDPADLHISRQ